MEMERVTKEEEELVRMKEELEVLLHQDNETSTDCVLSGRIGQCTSFCDSGIFHQSENQCYVSRSLYQHTTPGDNYAILFAPTHSHSFLHLLSIGGQLCI